MRPQEKVMYKADEVAQIIGVHIKTLYRYIAERKLRAVKPDNGRYLIHANDVRAFLDLEIDEPLEPLSTETFDVTHSTDDSAGGSSGAPVNGDALGS